MVIHAFYENGVFRPQEPVELPDGCQVELVLREKRLDDSRATDGQPLVNLASIAAAHPQNPDAPSDLASQHDHYLYGAAKR
jgi:predicted DNA-binding antitoxin AbrB/MazE fold protein